MGYVKKSIVLTIPITVTCAIINRISDLGCQAHRCINFFYDYPFSTPTKNAVNKRIIERPISLPRLRRGKDNRQLYLVPDITSFILVFQRDDHNFFQEGEISRLGGSGGVPSRQP